MYAKPIPKIVSTVLCIVETGITFYAMSVIHKYVARDVVNAPVESMTITPTATNNENNSIASRSFIVLQPTATFIGLAVSLAPRF